MPLYRAHAGPFIRTHLGETCWRRRRGEGEEAPVCCIAMRLAFACRVEQFIRQFADVIETQGVLSFFFSVVTCFSFVAAAAANWQQAVVPPAYSVNFPPWPLLTMFPASSPRSACNTGGGRVCNECIKHICSSGVMTVRRGNCIKILPHPLLEAHPPTHQCLSVAKQKYGAITSCLCLLVC